MRLFFCFSCYFFSRRYVMKVFSFCFLNSRSRDLFFLCTSVLSLMMWSITCVFFSLPCSVLKKGAGTQLIEPFVCLGRK